MKHPITLDRLFGSRLRNYESPVPANMFDRIMEERDRQKTGFWYRTGGKTLFLSALFGLMAGIGGSSPADKNKAGDRQKNPAPASRPLVKPAVAASFSKEREESAPQAGGVSVLLTKPGAQISNGAAALRSGDLKTMPTGVKPSAVTAAADARQPGVSPGDLRPAFAVKSTPPLSSIREPKEESAATVVAGSIQLFEDAGRPNNALAQNGATDIAKLSRTPGAVLSDRKDSLTLNALISKMAKPGPGLGCPSFTSRNTIGNEGWYFDIYGSPELAMREFKDRNTENSPYAKARDSTERPWYAFSAGMRASYVFNSGFAIRFGLIYAQNNEVFTYHNPAETRIITVIDSIFDANGKLTGTQTKQEKVTRIHDKITYNRYRSVDVPVQIGYEWGVGENDSWSVNGGANLNILTWRKADILGPDYLPLSVTSNFDQKNTVYKSTTGISLYGSVAYYRLIGETTQLMIEPHITYALGSLTGDNYPISHRYTNLGLIVGLRWKL